MKVPERSSSSRRPSPEATLTFLSLMTAPVLRLPADSLFISRSLFPLSHGHISASRSHLAELTLFQMRRQEKGAFRTELPHCCHPKTTKGKKKFSSRFLSSLFKHRRLASDFQSKTEDFSFFSLSLPKLHILKYSSRLCCVFFNFLSWLKQMFQC